MPLVLFLSSRVTIIYGIVGFRPAAQTTYICSVAEERLRPIGKISTDGLQGAKTALKAVFG